MWIRSQDNRELLHVYHLQAVNPDLSHFGPYTAIQGYMLSGMPRKLGEYASEDEALKVLDLIQCQHDMDVYEHGPEGMRVFQMPPKGFTRED